MAAMTDDEQPWSQSPHATSEAVREEETLRYGASLLAESALNDSTDLPNPSSLSVSADAALSAFAQLTSLKLNVERVFISLFDSRRQHIVAEATQSTVIDQDPSDPDRVPQGVDGDSLLLSGTAIPRSHGICEHVLDLPPVQSSAKSVLPVLVVPDIAQDARFCQKPYFGPASSLRFYAGVPLRSPQGIDIGVMCVLDGQSRQDLDLLSQRFLRHASHLVMSRLQSRMSVESHRRNERMVRGLGSMVEGTGSISRWHNAPNPESFFDIKGQEGSLNAQQQFIQSHGTAPPVNSARRKFESALPAEDTERESKPPPGEPRDALRKTQSITSFAEEEEEDDKNVLRMLFSRASNIIRESIEVEGALFLDASICSFGGLVTEVDEDIGEHRRSSSSSGYESTTTDNGIRKARQACDVLGFSTSELSSVNGESPPTRYTTVPDKFLESVLRRYPDGQIFNFDEDGGVIRGISDSEEGDHHTAVQPSESKTPPARIPRKSDGQFLATVFPESRSVAVVPLWDSHKEKWYAGGIVWTKARSRIFSTEGELSYLKAFGSAIMAEVARIDVLRADKAKKDVLGSLSHEIRSPLHGIILGVELLHDSELTGFQNDVLHTVETCGRTLLDTLDHLLDFSKVNRFLRSAGRRASGTQRRGMDLGRRRSIESGMMSVFSDISLDMLLEEVVESVYAGISFQQTSDKWATRERNNTSYFDQVSTLRRLESVRQMDTNGGNKGVAQPSSAVAVYLSIDPNVSWGFNAQPGALRRVIMNIFGNALKYTTRGSILVSLTQEPVLLKKRSRRRVIVFSISDSGRGISSEYLKSRLFTPFSQENQLSAGAGLGLSIVKQIVHGLRGQIGVDSRAGFGTTVRISLPLRLSSPSNSPDRQPLHLSDDLAESVSVIDGLTVSLVGFANTFGTNQPLAAENTDRPLSPRHFMQTLCRRFLHLKVLPELEASKEVPSMYICNESAIDEALELASPSSPPPPIIIICDSVLSAQQLTTRFASSSTAGIKECVSQPTGPRKLGKVLALAWRRWTDSQAAGNIPSQVSSSPKELAAKVHPASLGGDLESSAKVQSKTPEEKRREQEQEQEQIDPQGTHQPSVARELLDDPGPVSESCSDNVPGKVENPTPSLGSDEMRAFLLVEDNAINLKILESYMKKLGRLYHTASNGWEALEACRATASHYHCIFMDISMPVMDGLESTRHIRARERQHQLKPALIIALTGLASAETQEEAFASGVDLFLTKPVPLKELGRILETHGV